MGFLEWGRFCRLQTAAVEMGGFGLAALIGGATGWWILYAALFGVLVHAAGFSQNTLHDFIGGYDNEPDKAHHPLQTGAITVRQGNVAVYGLMAIGIAVFFLFDPGRFILPWLFLFGYLAFGTLYNTVGKLSSIEGVLEISIAFFCGFLAVGTVWTGSVSPLLWAAAVFGLFMTMSQIAVAGFIKDIAHPRESNLLRRLGTRIEPPLPAMSGLNEDVVRGGGAVVVNKRAMLGDWLFPNRATWALAFGLSWAKAIALGAIAYLLLGWWWGIEVAVVSFVAFSVYTIALLRPGPFDRPRRVKVMGLGEAGSYLLLVLALVPVLWPWLWAVFIILPVLWYVSMNRMLWSGSGSAWAPGV